ncbi:Imp TRAP-type uncharacterized transport system, periplasmic component [uncultured Caudovirales phage]|uniref:Imp TRAP-type uncharacterized transport system, periplasmic component n=1 Tax=uncultured Caudovirales phage TaxID=2100421 RepID=A0A6J5KS91_9CAUD|nr:Imp TRAP-type uncharacterized transport system, periplasmic component [uncultured Caudovirales phage]
MKFLTIMLILALSLPTFAEDSQIVIAADSSSGTYKKMLGEIVSACSTENFQIIEAKGVSGGAPGNLDALVNNQAQAAFLHSDVFFANSQADSSYKRFKTLVALYPEPIHILALRNSKTKKNGNFSFGKVEFNSLASMSGYTIGAAGGGVYTARILKGQGEGNFNLNVYNSGKEVLEALDRGDISAALFVGAQPLPNIQQLDKSKYKLLPIGENIVSKVKGVYRVASINYNGLTNGPIQTLAPIATIITRQYNTPKKIEAQKHFRDCFYSKLDELKDSGSPNWQFVEKNDKGVLDWYEIPVTTKGNKK